MGARRRSKRRTSWRVLAKQISKQIPPGYLRFQTEPGTAVGQRVAIVAHYRGRAPKIDPLTVTVRGNQHTVEVRTRATRAVRATVAGPSAFTGVYPGAAIAADLGNGAREWGAICALLSANQADPQPTHLVTCGHMFPPQSVGTSVLGGSGGEVIGTLARNLLDQTSSARDIALVELSPEGQAQATAGGPGPKLQDYLPASQIFALTVRTYRPTTGGYSSTTSTASTTTPSAHIAAALWPNGFSVENVIATTAVVSTEGDSGTVLATLDPIAIGSCSASGGGQSLFEPLGRVIDTVFQPQLNLTLWNNP